MLQKNRKFKGYKVDFDRSAKKDMKRLDHKVAEKVRDILKKLIAGDQSIFAEKLTAKGEQYRISFGQYRIIFHEHKHIITILVVAVRTRENAYRDV